MKTQNQTSPFKFATTDESFAMAIIQNESELIALGKQLKESKMKQIHVESSDILTSLANRLDV